MTRTSAGNVSFGFADACQHRCQGGKHVRPPSQRAATAATSAFRAWVTTTLPMFVLHDQTAPPQSADHCPATPRLPTTDVILGLVCFIRLRSGGVGCHPTELTAVLPSACTANGPCAYLGNVFIARDPVVFNLRSCCLGGQHTTLPSSPHIKRPIHTVELSFSPRARAR